MPKKTSFKGYANRDSTKYFTQIGCPLAPTKPAVIVQTTANQLHDIGRSSELRMASRTVRCWPPGICRPPCREQGSCPKVAFSASRTPSYQTPSSQLGACTNATCVFVIPRIARRQRPLRQPGHHRISCHIGSLPVCGDCVPVSAGNQRVREYVDRLTMAPATSLR